MLFILLGSETIMCLISAEQKMFVRIKSFIINYILIHNELKVKNEVNK